MKRKEPKGGIGIWILHTFVVVGVVPESPAGEGWLQSIHRGDIISKINGKKTDNLSRKEVTNLIQGPLGTTVTLTICVPTTKETKEVKLLRKLKIRNNKFVGKIVTIDEVPYELGQGRVKL